jgi:hypothetical protein
MDTLTFCPPGPGACREAEPDGGTLLCPQTITRSQTEALPAELTAAVPAANRSVEMFRDCLSSADALSETEPFKVKIHAKMDRVDTPVRYGRHNSINAYQKSIIPMTVAPPRPTATTPAFCC